MTLEAHLQVVREPFRLDVTVHVEPGRVLAVLGPNGAGKTTVIRALAGLEPLAGGHVRLAGRLLADAAAGRHLPPERRGIGLVPAGGLLFPHLSALDNVAFGPRSAGQGRTAARTLARDWLKQLGIDELTARRPAQLSSGQAQRVALARALAPRPALLLLDEPLSALDIATRDEVRHRLHAQVRGYDGVTLLVTHDPLDALALGDELLVLDHGTVAQQGTPTEVVRRPRTPYVAALAGVNLYRGVARGKRVLLDEGGELVHAAGEAGRGAEQAEGRVLVVVRPQAIALHREQPEGSPRNVWRGVVRGRQWQGDRVRVDVTGSPEITAEVTPAAVEVLHLLPGEALWVAVKATDIEVYPE